MNRTITGVPGVLAGHWTHGSGTTGCTVLVFPRGATAGGCVPGSAPGSRELGVLDPTHVAGEVHAFCLSGGSAFGLATADGVMAHLAAAGIGFDAMGHVVPIVPTAVLFDLAVGRARPDARAGRSAAEGASGEPLPEGRVGAGAGATVAKATGTPLPGGLGSSLRQCLGFRLGAIAAVNAFGSVRDPDSGAWLAGGPPGEPALGGDWRGNTSLVAVATDAPLSRPQATIVARMSQAGLARCLYPAFAAVDGDTVFVASTGKTGAVDALALTRIGHEAALAVAEAIVRAF
ncbi:MAG TPA: P1 family peptidase [Myxococcota bacterium]|nr:P1 family peptidase [Myxococcota bacterium]